ncbi:hypothetical protein I79_006325 [Cricetulus griseus]|uniref:Uncharacterized protein n=1 Tax=Cricetulus griseus TaxID=10029 RepID=G3H7J3_CRIGR|nr:hypothetical protein I79_006325 [Cricetulus griseus]
MTSEFCSFLLITSATAGRNFIIDCGENLSAISDETPVISWHNFTKWDLLCYGGMLHSFLDS